MRSLIFSLFVLLANKSYGQDYNKAVIQHAGEIGQVSFGLGKKINKYYSFSVHYGFVPKNELQNKIETYTFKNNLHLYHLEYKSFVAETYMGLALYHVPGNKYKTHELGATENNYYRQSSVRGLAYLGFDLSYRNKVSFFAESGLNDIWIINSINNDSIDYKDHVSLGIGASYRF
jgi:hypothetical protein